MLHFPAYEGQAGLKLDLQNVIPSPLLISHKDDVWSPFVSQHWTRFLGLPWPDWLNGVCDFCRGVCRCGGCCSSGIFSGSSTMPSSSLTCSFSNSVWTDVSYKAKINFNVKPVFMNHIVKIFFVCVSCHAAMKNGKQSAMVFIIDGISHCVVEPWMESMCLLMLQMKEVNITTTEASIVLSWWQLQITSTVFRTLKLGKKVPNQMGLPELLTFGTFGEWIASHWKLPSWGRCIPT